MGLDRSARNLVIAATAAVLTVGSAAAVVATTDHGPAAAPTTTWRIDAAETFGRSFAQFRSPVPGNEFDLGETGFVESGGTLVTMMALPNPRTAALDQPTMIGVDADTGNIRWTVPAGDLGGCAAEPLRGKVVCYSSSYEGDPTIIGFDARTGNVSRTSLPNDWRVLAIGASGDRLIIVEGDPESDDIEAHGGTFDTPDTGWTTTFDMGTAWEDLYSDQVLTLIDETGILEIGGSTAGFAVDSGRILWSTAISECSASARIASGRSIVTRTECRSGRVPGTDVYDQAGTLLFTTDSTSTRRPSLDRPSDVSLPLVIDESAYDSSSGELLWSDSELGAASHVAIVGDTVLVRTEESESALDLRTGTRLWQRASAGNPVPTAFDGRNALAVTSEALIAIDPHTGLTAWAVPLERLGLEGRGGGQSLTTTRTGVALVDGESFTTVHTN
ncbi:hypothetical protein ERC79_18160 [Rhodococcus sp. ABRD24]|uniref:outer membrane protein assembly factor BamB family protein n=1 Tax=Rhodococcus sp. ABRD24 TaxID=2507582 RepID=UPI00103B3CE8|nr:PQQ-binding-like beta-propeller repeat protein [Rhodococcus sp. ABRD24]QBJ97646.1 hypothetical protein ERC79_18160 [Rhodococcus sp. ABRD24]